MHKKSKIITIALGGLLIASSLGINNLAKADNFEFEIGTGNLNNTIENSAKVGSKLPKPEEGWKRYDDTSEKINYLGTWTFWNSSRHPIYKRTAHYARSAGQKVKFNFTGSKLRLISFSGSDRASDIKILIDNEEYSFNTRTGTYITTYLAFNKTDLEDKEHSVEITSGSAGYAGFILDAIDIDENGELKVFDEIEDNRPPLFLNKTSLDLSVYESDMLTANFTPNEATGLDNIKWTSSNPNVATVDQFGKVHGVSTGTTVITAELEDGSAKPAKCEIAVK